jgi:hypothetical protein
VTAEQATIDTTNARRAQLRAAAEGYFTGLAQKDFEAIPFAESVVLRAPLAPGGVNHPLNGRAALRTVWWPPIASALGPVRVLDYYINDALTSICAAAEVSVGEPPVVLRVVDRFIVDHAGRITEQENHFDPRDLTTPGWQAG